MAQILAIGITRAEQIPYDFLYGLHIGTCKKFGGGGGLGGGRATCLSGSFMCEIMCENVTLLTVPSNIRKQ